MNAGVHIRPLTVGLLGANCYILWQEGREDCVIIDPGGDAANILAACGGRTIAAILLTHGHFDHMAAAGELMGKDTQLVIHQQDAGMLQDPKGNVSWMAGLRVTAPKATCLVAEGSEVTFAGISLRVLHTPGHTPGSVCYEMGHALFTGDTLFQEGYGRTDLPGGSWTEMIASLKRVMPMRDTHTIYAGHGG